MDKNIAIEFDGVGKQYRLGLVGTGSLQHDLNRWWQTAVLRKEDPYLKIGEVNDRSKKGTSDYVWALKDISFKVEQGDVVGIIGKNGAGKSTLLKLLSHITAPSVGHINYRGRIASLLEVGTGFHPEMTARQNINMNGSIMGMSRHEITSKLDEIVDFAGIERYLDTPVKRFSSGMTVRLGFAVAAFLEPEILVVDEVLAVGDAEFQTKAIGKMQEVSSGGGRTVLFVSHNMNAVRRLCHNAVILKNGMVDYIGSAPNAIDKYLLDKTVEIASYVKIDNKKHRVSGFENPSIEIVDAKIIGDPLEQSSDEPLVFELTIMRHKMDIDNVYFAVILNDPLTEYRVFNYYSDIYKLKEGQNLFKVRLSCFNHNLAHRQYSVQFEVSTKTALGGKVIDMIRDVLSFSIKYICKKENKVWTDTIGLITLRGEENLKISII